jgi:hypothetical protein
LNREWHEAYISEDIAQDGLLDIVFTISDPTAPCEVQESKDCRKLGMAVKEMIVNVVNSY